MESEPHKGPSPFEATWSFEATNGWLRPFEEQRTDGSTASFEDPEFEANAKSLGASEAAQAGTVSRVLAKSESRAEHYRTLSTTTSWHPLTGAPSARPTHLLTGGTRLRPRTLARPGCAWATSASRARRWCSSTRLSRQTSFRVPLATAGCWLPLRSVSPNRRRKAQQRDCAVHTIPTRSAWLWRRHSPSSPDSSRITCLSASPSPTRASTLCACGTCARSSGSR
eukprot:5716910-Prymnesium_polylepis.1